VRGGIERLELIKCEAVRDWMAAEPPRARTLNGQFDGALRAARTRRGGRAPMPTVDRQRVDSTVGYVLNCLSRRPVLCPAARPESIVAVEK